MRMVLVPCVNGENRPEDATLHGRDDVRGWALNFNRKEAKKGWRALNHFE
jgi:hypothetical protein